MASIDKIYGTNEQYEEFHSWCENHAPGMLEFFYEKDGYEQEVRPITNTPIYADVWLWKNCNIDFVKDQLKDMYGGVPEIEREIVFFIEKIKPYIYADIYDKGFDYFVKPNDKTLYRIYGDGYIDTPLTIEDISK